MSLHISYFVLENRNKNQSAMGCSSSTLPPEGGDRREAGDFMTQDEIQLVKETWAVVALDMPATGLHIFTRSVQLS